VAIAVLLGVLGSGLLPRVLIGVISVVQLVQRGSRPHVAQLRRISGMNRFSDRERNPETKHVTKNPNPRLVVLDLSTSPHEDG
jgi:MFS superfamily sulfate permease-like transporter